MKRAKRMVEFCSDCAMTPPPKPMGLVNSGRMAGFCCLCGCAGPIVGQMPYTEDMNAYAYYEGTEVSILKRKTIQATENVRTPPDNVEVVEEEQGEPKGE